MTTQSYQNQKITKAGGSNSKTDEMNIWKGNINQRDIIVFVSSLLFTLLFITVVGKNAGYSVVHTDGLAVVAGEHRDHQVDAIDLKLAKGISENDPHWCDNDPSWCPDCRCHRCNYLCR
mmetsp:Transcript_32009/g.35631  ORF Transcript_32009/g.35631 Transcript_32009/m.35631 type:complete len:119 (-) Transcript_32009:40-396(-)